MVATIDRVFRDLVNAINDPATAPRLEITRNVRVAAFFPGDNVVRVHPDVFEVCRRFDKDSLNALAALLGHELAHYYRGFRYTREFGNGPYRANMRRVAYKQIVTEETEADLYAGFYCWIAGYNGTGVTPLLLERIYETFNIPDTLQDYLPKGERKSIAVRVEKELTLLLPVFDAAVSLTLARQYPEAQRCYEHVIRAFPSRELFNNAGVVYAMQALQIMEDEDVRFIYPLELDFDSRLRGTDVLNGRIDRGTRSPTAAQRVLIARLLDSAVSRFSRARTKDGAYAPALINLATVYILKQEYGKAIDMAAEAMALDTSSITRVLGVMVQSIAQARMGSPDKALKKMQEIRDRARAVGAGELAEANLAVLEKKNFSVPGGPATASPDETVHGFRAGDTSALTPADAVISIGGEFGLRIVSKELTDCTLLRAQKDSAWMQFIWTENGYRDATKQGIVIGSSLNDVKRRYGDWPRVVNARQGVFYIYDYSKLIFLVSPQGKVLKWAVYAVE